MTTRVVFAAALVALSMAAPASGMPDLGWSYIAIDTGEEFNARMGVAFTESGNAASVYHDYLKKGAEIESEAWFKDLPDLLGQKKKDPAKLKAALEAGGPHLDRLVAASKRRDYMLWGELYKPDPDSSTVEIELPGYGNLFQLCGLLISRGVKAIGDKDFDSAREDFMAVIRIGEHLEHDPAAPAFVMGANLKSQGAGLMQAASGIAGNKEDEKKWHDYSTFMRSRREAATDLLGKMNQWDKDMVSWFVKYEIMPESLRLECLSRHYHCLAGAGKCRTCRNLGPPNWVRELALEVEFKDPQAMLWKGMLDNRISKPEVCDGIASL